MIDSIQKNYIRDAVLKHLTTHISPKDMSRFCGLIMRQNGFRDAWHVVRYLKEYEEGQYYILRAMGHDPEEALEAFRGRTWTLEDENVQQKITDEYLEFLQVNSLTDSQIERLCNLIRRGELLEDAYDIVTELSEEQELLMFQAIADGWTPAHAWMHVTGSRKLRRTEGPWP